MFWDNSLGSNVTKRPGKFQRGKCYIKREILDQKIKMEQDPIDLDWIDLW